MWRAGLRPKAHARPAEHLSTAHGRQVSRCRDSSNAKRGRRPAGCWSLPPFPTNHMVNHMLDDLAADVTSALAGTLRTATLWKSEEVGDDGAGNIIYDYVAHACQGTRANYDARYAAEAGIPRTEVSIELLAGTLDIAPKNLDYIEIENAWHVITTVETDPATAVWSCQCTLSTDPR